MKNHRIAKLFTMSLILVFLFTCFGGLSSSTLAQAPQPPIQDPESLKGELPSCSPSSETSLALGGGGCVPSAGGWTIRTPLPFGEYGNAVASDGVYVYSAGGYLNSGQVSTYFGRYNPIADAWMTLSPLPTPVYTALAVYAEGKIYIFGGIDSSMVPINRVQIYSISSGTWSTTTMPGVRAQMGGGYWDGKIYLVGGFQTADVSSASKETWQYNITSNSWSAKALLPVALGGPASGVVYGHLYIIGGRSSTSTTLNTNYDYDIAGNTWSTRAVIPSVINQAGSAVYRGRIWVFGGGTPFDLLPDQDPKLLMTNNQTYIFDPSIDFWTTGPNQNISRSFQAGAVVRNRIVSIGGYSSTGSSSVVEVAIQNPLRILIVYADAGAPKVLQSRLLLQPGVGQVDLFKANSKTATYIQMVSYDLVVAYSNAQWFNATLQGDEIANYLSAGGTVVGLNFDWAAGFALGGLWTSAGYSPFSTPGSNEFSMAGLGTFRIGHPLLAGITSLNASYRQNLALSAGAISVADWNDASPSPLIALKNRVVGVSAYLGEIPAASWSGDFPSLIVNAGYLLRSGNGSCTSLNCPRTSVIEGAIDSSDPTMAPRLFRDDPSSTCDIAQSCSVSGVGPYRYDAYYFYNNSEALQCVSVTLDPDSCGSSLQVTAYSEFNPTLVCSGYLADVGASPVTVKTFSFNAPANSLYTVVVNAVNADYNCPRYVLSVAAAACAPSPISSIYLPLTQK